MAALPAPDSEAHMGASLNPLKPLVKKALESEALKVASERPGAAEHLLVRSLEVLKPLSDEEKQDSGAKTSHEEHASTPLCVPEMQASKSSAGSDVLPISQMSKSETSSEMEAEKLGADNLVERKEDLEAACTEHLLSSPNDSPDCKLSATTSSLDTVAPFESVKGAATLFGERADCKPPTQVLKEERVAPEFDVSKASKEILHCKERLAAEEAYIVDVLHELEKTKEQTWLCKCEAPVTSAAEGSSLPSNQPEEVSNASVSKDLYVDVLREVEQAEKEVENLLQRRSELERLKQSALRECEAAKCAEDDASTRVRELVKGHNSIQESVTALKAALTGTEAEITSLKSIVKIKLEGNSVVEPVHICCTRYPRLKSLELSVADADTSMETLMGELSAIRGVQMGKSECELLGANTRLNQAKAVEGNHVAAIGRVLEQLDETKLNLKKAVDEGNSLATTIGALQAEISKRHSELECAHETEQIACATLASLQDELCSVRAKVLSAQAGEMKAREAKRSLPASIKQLALDADESKVASNVAREEASKGRREIEQAKAGLRTALSRLQAAQKEAEVVRASEAMALAGLKALSEPESELGEKITVSISFEEYRALFDAGLEAEEAANKKVAAIFVQVDLATGSQQEAQEKLDGSLKELTMLLKDLEEAQKKADDAQAAKLSVEAELRKWRAEHEQWRKTGSNPSSVSTSAAQSPRFANGKSSQGRFVNHSFHGKAVAGLDSLAEVLTLKVPSSEKAAKVMPEMELPKKTRKAKKLSFFARLMSILVRKKSKTVR